jgi:hypothetical protein
MQNDFAQIEEISRFGGFRRTNISSSFLHYQRFKPYTTFTFFDIVYRFFFKLFWSFFCMDAVWWSIDCFDGYRIYFSLYISCKNVSTANVEGLLNKEEWNKHMQEFVLWLFSQRDRKIRFVLLNNIEYYINGFSLPVIQDTIIPEVKAIHIHTYTHTHIHNNILILYFSISFSLFLSFAFSYFIIFCILDSWFRDSMIVNWLPKLSKYCIN